LVVIVVVVVAIAGIGVYFALSHSVASTCGSGQTSHICVDQAEIPDSLDPAVTFSTPGWAAVQQVYQGLVNYAGSSVTNFSGVLAKNWTESANHMQWTFTLRSGVNFSNGDPYNAYVQWYSFYRSLLLEQGPQFIQEQNFFSTNFNATSPLTWYSALAASQAANSTLVTDLNTWNFDNPTASEIALMGTPGQSFQVLNPSLIALNLGSGYLGAVPYTYLLASISAPNSYAVDPNWVDAHGQVTEGQVNDYLASNTMGTGPYLLQNYNGVTGGGYTLAPSPTYWGGAVAASEPANNNLPAAKATIQVTFQDAVDITTNDLEKGNVQTASFAYIGPSTVQELQGKSNLNVTALPAIYGATSGSWWIFLNQTVSPFNNLSVREAVAHAINYAQIIQQAFGGYATQWVGPVPPSYPYYNPANLAPYQFNLTLAKQEIANSPCASNACAGTSINYLYLDNGADWTETAQFLVADLNAIGLTINPVPVSLAHLLGEQVYSNGACTSATGAYGGPFYMGQEFYTSDYISPDDWTQNDAYGLGSANRCMAGYNNGTVNTDVFAAASDSNPTNLTNYYTQMTSLMYNNYTEIWLVVPTAFSVASTNLHGTVQNPMASAEPFAIGFNTEYLS
jgi:peptide/nickel transport system substrate-binding protein